jgi:hypothetical protein
MFVGHAEKLPQFGNAGHAIDYAALDARFGVR